MFTNVRKMALGCYVLLRRRREPDARRRKFDREKLIYPFRLLFHPLAVFNDVKFEKKASLPLANLLVLLFFLEGVAQAAATGYLFNPDSGMNFNILPILAGTVGIVLIWTVCNWAMCTLNNGEGRMSEIWIATAYSLTPYLLLGSIGIVVSNILSLDESILYGTLRTIAVGWSLLLVFLGMMTVHQYTVKKTIASVIFTLLAILAACFLLLLFFAIAQQMWGFATGIVQELGYR